MATVAQSPKTSPNLQKDYLTYPEVIAQSISVIAPSTAPAAILGLIFVSAGNGTWLSFLLATVGLLFVCYNINQFARRSSSFPNNLLVWIFVAYMAVGFVWLLIQKARSPKMLPAMKHLIDEIDMKSSDEVSV